MDTNTINHVSLCSGYGGIDLGLKRAIGERLRTVAFVEVECFAVCNLAAKAEAKLLDSAPIWSDLRTFPWGKFHGLVDILSGGYPCQPFSAAGKRLGAEDPRHLWPFIAAGIAAMRPGVCFFENVEGHISLGLPNVLQDLAGMGYRTTWGVASASECGAPHQRKRVFILAHDQRQRVEELGRQIAGASQFDSAWNDGADTGCGELEHARVSSQNSHTAQCRSWHISGQGTAGQSSCGTPWPSRPGEQQFAWEPPRVVGAVPAKLADFCSRDSQSRGDTAQAGGESTGERRQGEDAMSDRGSSVCGGDQEAMGNASGSGHSRQAWSGGECAQGQPIGYVAESDGAMGHTNSPRPQERPRQRGSAIQGADADGGETAERQTQPPLGRDADGLTHRLDHAVLHVSTDNRTDELRLLGNGVVPATAERAFRVLFGELMEEQP